MPPKSSNPLADVVNVMNTIRARVDARNGVTQADDLVHGTWQGRTGTPEEIEEHIYAMSRQGLIRPTAADTLVRRMRDARAQGLDYDDEARARRAQEQREAEAERKYQLSLYEAGIPRLFHSASFEFDERGNPLVVDEGNSRAHGLLMRLADEWTPGHRGLTLKGKSGRGKTYLSIACLIRLRRRLPGPCMAMTSERDLLARFRESYERGRDDRKPSTFQVREWYIIRPDFLLLDDLGAEEPSAGERGEWARGQLLDLIEHRCRESKTTLITTNLTEAEIEAKYGGRILSRLTSRSPIIEICGSDWRQQIDPLTDDPFAEDAALHEHYLRVVTP